MWSWWYLVKKKSNKKEYNSLIKPVFLKNCRESVKLDDFVLEDWLLLSPPRVLRNCQNWNNVFLTHYLWPIWSILWVTFTHFLLITNIMLLGEHRPLHQRCDSEEPGGSFSLHLRAGSEPDLHPDGERLLRSVPAVWAVPGTPQVNWLVRLQGDLSLWSQICVTEIIFTQSL